MKKAVLLMSFVFIFYFTPADAEIKQSYYVEVSISKCSLRLYEVASDSSLKLIKEYVVATPRQGIKDYPRGEGKVTGAELNPWWYPTENTRESYLKKKKISLSKSIPPGHPLNAMGAGKIYLSHRTPQGENYRIHGTNEENSIGKRASSGCIRMKNADIKEVISLINEGETTVIINP